MTKSIELIYSHFLLGSQLNTPTLNCPPCSPAPTSSPSPPYAAAAQAAAAAAMAATSAHFPSNFKPPNQQVLNKKNV